MQRGPLRQTLLRAFPQSREWSTAGRDSQRLNQHIQHAVAADSCADDHGDVSGRTVELRRGVQQVEKTVPVHWVQTPWETGSWLETAMDATAKRWEGEPCPRAEETRFHASQQGWRGPRRGAAAAQVKGA